MWTGSHCGGDLSEEQAPWNSPDPWLQRHRPELRDLPMAEGVHRVGSRSPFGAWTLVLMPVQVPEQPPSAWQPTSSPSLLLAWQGPQLTDKFKGRPHCSLTELRPGTRAGTESWKMSLSDLVAGAGISSHQHSWLRRGLCMAMAVPK